MTKGELIGSGDGVMEDWQKIGCFAEGAYTMIGYKRLCNIEDLILDVVERGVPGDVIETGVWKGGAVIWMKYLLDKLGSNKKVYVADSFEGLPSPDGERYPLDAGWDYSTLSHLSISEEQVRKNFDKFGLLDDRVIFVKGWFKDTLPSLPGPFCIIRLDGDMYESTINALDALYGKLSPGGYCIIDDWCLIPANTAAIDYRSRNGITDPVIDIDWSGSYWQKAK